MSQGEIMFRGSDQQMTFCDVDAWCGDLISENSFFARMQRYGDAWFRDEDFADLYKDSGTGRPTLPPAMIARALILQNYAPCSDRELVARIRFDLRYKKALDIPVDHRGFHPSLLSHFRARLILNEKSALVFEKSIEAALSSGVLNSDDVQAFDSMPVIGAAALQDTYTLLRTQLQKGLRIIGKILGEWESEQAHSFEYPFEPSRYLAKDNLGKPDIAWDDKAAKKVYLGELVRDSRALLGAIDESKLVSNEKVQQAAELLRQLLGQDVDEESSGGPSVKKGGSNRVLSTNDPDMRHGRKCKSKLIKGYKAHVQANENEIVTGIDITPANIHDAEPVPNILDDQKSRGLSPKRIYGDCAYGNAKTRALCDEQGIEVVSKVLMGAPGNRFSRRDFEIHSGLESVKCPGQQTTTESRPRRDDQGRPIKAFHFSKEQCTGCSLKSKCLPKTHVRRWVVLHHHEEQIQKALKQNSEPEFKEDYKRRVVIERVQARLQSYGLRLARYFSAGRVKLQAMFTAAANNFWRIAQISEATEAVRNLKLAGSGKA